MVKEFYTRPNGVLGDAGGSASYWEYMMRVSKWVFLSCLSLAFVGCASDDDGDGFSDKDCDDNNATVNPDADEVCDGIDNNCDGRVDEGLILEYYADLDGAVLLAQDAAEGVRVKNGAVKLLDAPGLGIQKLFPLS